MLVQDGCAFCVMPYATTATNATQSMVFDTKGFDHCNLFVAMGTHATGKAALSTLKITESDTSTVISSQSAIVALTGGTATSSSVGFKIPTAVYMGPGAGVEFSIDLRTRKRYLGLQLTPGDATAKAAWAVARLSRAEYSRDTACLTLAGVTTGNNEKYAKNYAATSSTACALFVTA